MKKNLPYIYIGSLVIATAVLVATVKTGGYIRMRVVDRFDTVSQIGVRTLFYSVAVSDFDSMLIAQYATKMYHKEIPKILNDTGAVQMNFYFYKEENLEAIDDMQALQIARGNTNAVEAIQKCEVDTSGYMAVRFSNPWMLFGRDTLYVAKSPTLIPHHGNQWKDIIRNQK